MILTLDWPVFHQRFLKDGITYVEENESYWAFYAADAPFIIRSIVDKKEDQAENMMFIERYLSGNNIIKVRQMNDQTPVLADNPMVSDAAVREEEDEYCDECEDPDYPDEELVEDDGYLGVTTTDNEHSHHYKTNEQGDGSTYTTYPLDHESHIHEIKNFEVMESNNHIHKIIREEQNELA